MYMWKFRYLYSYIIYHVKSFKKNWHPAHARDQFQRNAIERGYKDLEDEESKVYALTYWLAKNIRYDYSAFLSNTLSRHSSKEVLKRRKALVALHLSARMFFRLFVFLQRSLLVILGMSRNYYFCTLHTTIVKKTRKT